MLMPLEHRPNQRNACAGCRFQPTKSSGRLAREILDYFKLQADGAMRPEQGFFLKRADLVIGDLEL